MAERIATSTAEYFIHQYHWLHAKELFELSTTKAGNPVVLDTTGLLSVAFAVEAHANWLLEAGCPTEYADERAFFNTEPYRGTLGKLTFLAVRLEIPLDRGARSFQSLRSLSIWRDRMVHARVERLERTEPFVDADNVRVPESELLTLPSQMKDTFLRDAEALADALQEAAEKACWKNVNGAKAFSGFLGLRGVSLSDRPA